MEKEPDMNGLVIGGIAALLILAFTGFQSWKIGDLESKMAKAAQDHKDEVRTYIEADVENQSAIAACRDATADNIANALERQRESGNAGARAEKHSAQLEAELEDLNARTIKLRLADACPTTDDPAFLDFVCNGPLGCQSTR